MMTDPTILIVEDEPPVAELVAFALRNAGLKTAVADTAAQAFGFMQQRRPQLMVLDWMLPDQTGLRILARLRADRNLQHLPVIMLTARAMEEDKIAGLDSGADDYMTKPFSPRELVARVKALLRRKSPEYADAVLRLGAIELDPASASVRVDGQRIDMGHAEFKLLKFFLAHPNRVFSRAQLLDSVWGTHVVIEERTVDVHVLRIRKALGAAQALLRTIRGEGYILSED